MIVHSAHYWQKQWDIPSRGKDFHIILLLGFNVSSSIWRSLGWPNYWDRNDTAPSWTVRVSITFMFFYKWHFILCYICNSKSMQQSCVNFFLLIWWRVVRFLTLSACCTHAQWSIWSVFDQRGSWIHILKPLNSCNGSFTEGQLTSVWIIKNYLYKCRRYLSIVTVKLAKGNSYQWYEIFIHNAFFSSKNS